MGLTPTYCCCFIEIVDIEENTFFFRVAVKQKQSFTPLIKFKTVSGSGGGVLLFSFK